MYEAVDLAKEVKSFLELVQPVPVRYGYVRGVVEETSYITYRNMATNIRRGIGNTIINETATFVVTVQTKTAEQNLIYSAMIRYATSGSPFMFISEDFRRDLTVENGWINTIILSVSGRAGEGEIPSDKVKNVLQDIADRYIMVTSIYKKPFSDSIIDKFIVPDLEKEFYTMSEVIALKKEYFDRFILTITEY